MDKLIQQLLEAMPVALPGEWGDLLPQNSSCRQEAMAEVEASLINIIDARLAELGLLPSSAARSSVSEREQPYEHPR